MVIDHLNTLVEGGAANAAIRIHQSLLKAGVDSRFWFDRERVKHPLAGARQIEWPTNETSRWAGLVDRIVRAGRRRLVRWQLQRNFSSAGKSSEIFTTPYFSGPTPFPPEQLRGDILNLHWVAAMLDYPSFFASLPTGQPVVWTLHDMNPFTGGCHFSGECQAFEAECGYCPQLKFPSQRDLANRSFQIKLQALQGKQLHIVAPSQWLAQRARRSRIFASARSIRVIPYGLDTEQFVPVDRRAARQELGLPPDRFILACGAASVTHHRKGFGQLLEALSRLTHKPDVLAVVFGQGNLPPSNFELPEVCSVGYLNDPATQALVYSAADVFVLPSLEDNLPQTGLESLACGTPVVGFDTGGIPDFVHPGKTGLLARRGNAADLAVQIEWLRQHPDERAHMGRRGRQLILEQFQAQREARQYVALYRELLESQTATARAA